MKLECLRIKNFRSIKEEIKVNFSKNKTVLVGQNNAGKTNIILALDILFGGKYPTYYSLEKEDFFDPERPTEIEAKLSEINKERDYPHIKWKERHEKSDKGRISYNKGELYCKFTARLKEEEIIKNYEIYVEKPYPPQNGKNKVFSISDDFRNSLLSFVFVPADRTIRVDLKSGEYTWYGKLLRQILESRSQSEEYRDLLAKLNEIEDIIRKILKSDSVLQTGRLLTFIEDFKFSLTRSQKPEDLLKNIEILIKDKFDKYFELSRFGHGTQSAILIGLLELYLSTISNARDSVLKVLAIDEPENFLHPQGKRLINSLLDEISQDENTQIIYTTHSTELVTNFEENRFTLKDIIYVYKRDGFTQVKQFAEKDIQEFLKIQEELDVNKGEIFFASRVILVEGETEKHSIPVIYKCYQWKNKDLPSYALKTHKDNPASFFDPDRKNISIVNVGGKTNIPKYFKFASILLGPRKVAIIADKDFGKDNFKKKIKNLIKNTYEIDRESDLEKYGVFLLKKGEFEHYYKVDVIKQFLFKVIEENMKNDPNINQISDERKRNQVIDRRIKKKEKELEVELEKVKVRKSNKISKAYEDLFSKYLKGYTKPVIAFKLTKYLLENDGFDEGMFVVLRKVIHYFDLE